MPTPHPIHATYRRHFIKQIFTLAASVFAGFLTIKTSLAARNAGYFLSNQYQETLKLLFDNQEILDSNLLAINLPEIAENGAVVPLTISSDLETLDNIYVLVEKNPTPLALEISLSPGIPAYFTARIKMAESSQVVIFARNGSQWLKTQKWVTVVVGGCGTG